MASPKPPPGRRAHYLDNLRTFATTLVIHQHAAVAYGGAGAMPPHSACFDKSHPAMLPILGINASYGMGTLFWLSGRMSAKSITKSKDWDFVKAKLMRLGIPTLLYSVFVDPLQAVTLTPRDNLREALEAYFKEVLNFKGVTGSCWFPATLLVFDLCAVVLKRCRALWRSGRAGSSEFSSLAKLYVLLSRWGWLAAAGGSMLASSKFPPGKPLPFIHVEGFYVIQYLYAYALGHMAYHLGKSRMPSLYEKGPNDKLSLYKATALSLAALSLAMLPAYLKSRKGETEENENQEKIKETENGGSAENTGKPTPKDDVLRLGGLNMTTALVAAWSTFTFHTMGPALVSVFERNQNHPAKTKLWSPRYSYAAFLLHSPISWFVGLSVEKLTCPQGKRPEWMASKAWADLGPIVMGGAVGLVDIVASFGLGQLLIDHVPGVGNFV